MTIDCKGSTVLMLALLAGVLGAQQSDAVGLKRDGSATSMHDLAAVQLADPPVRRVESAMAISSEPFGAITGIRVLASGQVLVNDGTRRRLVLLDSALAFVRVVLDSVTEARNAYGATSGALLAYRGDSSLFIDPSTLGMLVLDPHGQIARVRSVPRAENAQRFTSTGGNAGYPAFDAKGRLVYRINARATFPQPRPPRGVPYFRTPPDTALVVAIDLETRKIDTLGSVRIQPPYVLVRKNANGAFATTQINNPVPLVDDWAVLADGTVAFVRGRDYRIEWLQPDGTLRSSDKLPFPWVRLTPEDKERFVDSLRSLQVRAAQITYTMQLIFWTYQVGKPYPDGFSPPPGFVVPNGLPRDVVLPPGVSFPANYRYACPTDARTVDSMLSAAGGASRSGNTASVRSAGEPACIQNPFEGQMLKGYFPPMPQYRPPNTIPASELPDYRPPFNASAARADADGNLWIRTNPMKPRPGGPVFDVVNRAGRLFDRIQFPTGYSIAGFGSGRVVYLTMRDANGPHLVKVQLQ